MECLDSRRLTGPNIVWDRPGAVLDVRFGDVDADRLIETWRQQVRRMLDAVGWDGEEIAVRRFPDGASLAISAPRDALYAATDINDWAWNATRESMHGSDVALEPGVASLRAEIDAESRPALLALLSEARNRGLPAVCDDDALTLGTGAGGQTWPIDELPDPAEVTWERLHAIPVVLVTGTNGKTTSVRLAAQVAVAAGLTPGLSSTDWISVGGEILDAGDYSGPGGARTVLRDTRVEMAILETARGGLLRRGLGVERVDAALITNVAADHLGEFGVEDVPQLAEVKWIVTQALGRTGRLILNADDPLLLERGRRSDFSITWFSIDPSHPQLRSALATDGRFCTVEDDHIVYVNAGQRQSLVHVGDIPITLGGMATHNIGNCLGVVGLMAALGLPAASISAGLMALHPRDNPGRSNLFVVDGVNVILDFAHNPHGLEAFLDIGRNMEAQRRILVIGQAGDRGDDDIRALVQAACQLRLDRIFVKRMARYSRGRPDGQTAEIIRDEFSRQGYDSKRVTLVDLEIDAVAAALKEARSGDLVMLLIHEDRDAAVRFVEERASSSR